MLNKDKQGLNSQSWIEAVAQLESQHDDYVIATVLQTKGSTPRATGTKFVVTQTAIFATLGGGNLEYQVIETARHLLTQGVTQHHVEKIHLSAQAGQCCGGMVTILFEVNMNATLALDVYGAGHVSHALMTILAALPVRIRWIDSRSNLFPETIPSSIESVVTDQPVAEVVRAPARSAFLVLTHDHDLDFKLAQAILKRDDVLWFGMIGSHNKAQRFRQRLVKLGLEKSQADRMISPVGMADVKGKRPMEISVSIAAELIQLYQEHYDQHQQVKALPNDQIKTMMNELISEIKH